MKWPLSMSFDKLISRTADKGKAQYTLPSAGLLTPDKTVLLARAGQERQGRLGAVEQDLELHAARAELSAGRDLGTTTRTRARGPSSGRPTRSAGSRRNIACTAATRRAFRSATCRTRSTSGISKELSPQFPANFIAETTATELAVLGGQVELAHGQQDLLSRGGGGRAGQAERAFRLCHRAASGDLQQAGGAGQGRRGVPRPGLGQLALWATCGMRWPERCQLLGHREAQVCPGEGPEVAQAGRGHRHALRHARRAGEVRGGGHRHDRPGSAEAGDDASSAGARRKCSPPRRSASAAPRSGL